MKKRLFIILIVLQLLQSNLCALSEPVEIFPGTLVLTDSQTYDSANSLCWIDESLYILGSRAVYHWTKGMAAPEVFYDLSEAAAYQYIFSPPKDEQGANAWSKAIRYLFVSDKSLYGLHPYSGQIYEVTPQELRPIAKLPGELLQAGEKESSFFREIKGVTCSTGELFLLLGTDDYDDYTKTELFSFDLTDQSLTLCSPDNIRGISTGPNGKLILLIQDNEVAICQYDIETDVIDQKLSTLQSQNLPSGLAWYEEKSSIAYYNENRISSADATGIPEIKGYLPVLYANATTPASCSADGIYAYPYASYVFLRDISIEGEVKQTVLNLIGAVSPSIIVAFSVENPDVAVVTSDTGTAEYLNQAFISSDSSVDLIVASAPGDFVAMKQKGFSASLNGNSELVELAHGLYPTLQDVVFDGEDLLAYPLILQPHSWTINETRWQELELGDYPATYDALFKAIDLWLEEYAEEYPEYTLSDIQQSSLDTLVNMIVREYIFQNETTGERLSFDTPSFRTLMTMVSENAHLLSEENEQWGMPLLSSYYQGFGCTYNDDDQMRMLLPPTLDEEKTQMLNASVEVLFVNAASQQKEAATRFVSFCARNLDINTKYMLYPNLNEPYQSPTYESRLATLNEELEGLQSRLEKVDDSEVASIRDEIAQKERMIESLSSSRWQISPESISVYRSVAETLRVPCDSEYLSEGESGGYGAIASVIAQYCSDGLEQSEIDSFIKELDRVTYLVYMEGQ